jgi:hypothetical protein
MKRHHTPPAQPDSAELLLKRCRRERRKVLRLLATLERRMHELRPGFQLPHTAHDGLEFSPAGRLRIARSVVGEPFEETEPRPDYEDPAGSEAGPRVLSIAFFAVFIVFIVAALLITWRGRYGNQSPNEVMKHAGAAGAVEGSHQGGTHP